MWTLKEFILVKLAAGFVNDYDTRKMINRYEEEIWMKVIRERISTFHIPLIWKEEIIVLFKSMAIDVIKWRSDHNGTITMEQEKSLKFCFNADGTVDPVKTVHLLIHSERLDLETCFILACRHWPIREAIVFFDNLHESAWEQIRHKRSTSSEEDEGMRQYIKQISDLGKAIRLQTYEVEHSNRGRTFRGCI
ncbi:hypothetical protein TNCT_97061 [Trichonephila clavata]|uniref:Uncharacterized protein n=1 Tax=Trichonephila clavata TaxID=2740835 RepID=A0A8X6KSH9_TRICU|nr:hypothetical protein TNCT_97061 [Trichonephila clavata]